MISFKGNRPDTAPHRLFILIFLACIKHHCFFCPPFHLHVLHSRSKRNVKRVSASLESFHFTRAKRTWPRRAADRNVSSSWPERASVQSPPAPLLPRGGEIWHFSVAAEPGTCLHWPNSAVLRGRQRPGTCPAVLAGFLPAQSGADLTQGAASPLLNAGGRGVDTLSGLPLGGRVGFGSGSVPFSHAVS